jgi:hypothetical protein
MRTRLIVIGVFLCAAVLPAALAASAYAQARHDPCLWSADYCSPLDNLLFAGAVFRGCAISLFAQAATLAALIFWQWRSRKDLDWEALCAGIIFFPLLIAIAWGISEAALNAYAQFYYSVPTGAGHDAKVVLDFQTQLGKAMSNFTRLGAVFVFMTGVSAILCGLKIWNFLKSEELDHEIAAHEEHRRHEHPESTHSGLEPLLPISDAE